LDDDLLTRCQRGDAAALSALIRRHQDRLFRVAFRVLRDPGRAEDAVADAFAAVWVRCGKWRGEAAATWIHRVAYNVVLDHARSRRRWWRLFGGTPGPAQEPVAAEKEPTTELADRDQQALRTRRLEQAIATLTPEDRMLVHLHYFEGQSLAEVALVLETTRDALKMRLSRARVRLREALGDGDELF
jgi:RNA polymerase sigma-70 factor, ECF subfamily